MHYSAWAHDGDTPHRCVVADISDTGARLEVDDPTKIPDKFTLLLDGPDPQRRTCHVVWRTESEVGVAFETAAR
jgi:hypothetical protein